MRNIISTTVVASILVLGALCSSARGGGCCYPWENPYGDVAWFCVDVPNETVCGYYPGGVYQGDSTFCLGDNNADGHDDLCVPPAIGACCFPDGSCTEGNFTQQFVDRNPCGFDNCLIPPKAVGY